MSFLNPTKPSSRGSSEASGTADPKAALALALASVLVNATETISPRSVALTDPQHVEFTADEAGEKPCGLANGASIQEDGSVRVERWLENNGPTHGSCLLSYCGVAAVSVSSTRSDARRRDPTPSRDRDHCKIVMGILSVEVNG